MHRNLLKSPQPLFFDAATNEVVTTRYIAHKSVYSRSKGLLLSALVIGISPGLMVPAHATSQTAVAKTQSSTHKMSTEAPRQAAQKPRVILVQTPGPPSVSDQPSNAPAAAPNEPENPSALTIPVGPDDDNTSATLSPAEDAGDAGATATAPGDTTPDVDEDSVATGTGEIDPALVGKSVALVRVVGNRVVPSETILQQVTTQAGGTLSANQIATDLSRIGAIGFFASVQQQITPNLEDPNRVDVAFIVVENRAVTGFTFEGNTRIPASELEAVLSTKVGTVLNRNTINADVEKLQNLYRERGLAALVTESRQNADGKVLFILQEARLSRIDIIGLKKTNEALIRRLIRTKPGASFDQIGIRADLNRIFDTGFFEDITYNTPKDDPAVPGSVIVTVTVKEKRTGQFGVGVGFDNRSRISGYVSVGESNLFGQGKRASASVELGAQRTFELGYGDSYVGSRLASYDISVFSRLIQREPTIVERVTGGTTNREFRYEEKRTGIRLNFTNPLNENRDTSLLFGFRAEEARLFEVGNDRDSDESEALNSSGTIVALSGGFVRDKRDLRLDPSRGSRQQLILEQAVGGSSKFTKLDFDVRYYIPLIGPDKNLTKGDLPLPKLVFAHRLVAGVSRGQLPAFEQYFVGGTETVRGYDADEQFGDNQVYTNLELRYRLNKQFQIVGFADAGKAYGGRFSSDSGTNDILYSVGAGVRVRTPIGPVRLDVARGKDGVKTHFGIGSTF
jgi:outer membrane protein insertion porin family